MPNITSSQNRADELEKNKNSLPGQFSGREVYPVREYPATSHGAHFSHTNARVNAPREFSNGVYELRKKQKEENKKQGQKKEVLNKGPNKVGHYVIYSLAGLGLVGGFWWLMAVRSVPSRLPPTTMEGHIEESPKAHISNTPIPEAIQRHMLEHADGKGKPGIIIQYNCQKYACQADLVEKLTNLAKEYPDNIYLAPNNYDGKIILTKEGKMETLDSFDEQKIKDFIK
jgi:hypothetical protein